MKTLFMDVQKALALTTKIASRYALLDADVQKVAETAIYHSNVIGDQNCDIGLKLVAAMGKGSKTASLKVYLATYGQFGLKDPDDNKSFGFVANEAKQIKKDDMVKAAQLHAVLQANAWYDAVKEPEISAFLDAAKKYEQLISAIKKAIKAGKPVVYGDDPMMQLIKSVVEGDKVEVKEVAE